MGNINCWICGNTQANEDGYNMYCSCGADEVIPAPEIDTDDEN